MSDNTLNISSILHEVGNRRWKENFVNVFKVFGILALATFLAWLTLVIIGGGQPEAFQSATMFVGILLWITIGTALAIVTPSFILLFWPFILYFWANVVAVRRRTLLSLIQTALETKTPLPAMIRTYASGCLPGYAFRLKRFAAALESGTSLEEAVRSHWSLFRYDVAGMIRLGGNEPATLKAVEEIAQDERDFSIFRTSQTIRATYLFIVIGYMMLIMSFVFINIVPKFKEIYEDFDVTLPDLTLAVIAVSNEFVKYWYLLAPLTWLVCMVFLVYLILQTNIAIFRPLGFRRLFRSTDAAKFLAVVAVGIRHQFAIPAILEMYRWTVPSEYLRKKGKRVQTTIERGRNWIDAVRRAGFISRAEASLLHSAERTGNTSAVLDQLSRSKERTQIREDELYSKMVFIPLMFFLGAIVGIFALAMFMPLVTLIWSLC